MIFSKADKFLDCTKMLLIWTSEGAPMWFLCSQLQWLSMTLPCTHSICTPSIYVNEFKWNASMRFTFLIWKFCEFYERAWHAYSILVHNFLWEIKNQPDPLLEMHDRICDATRQIYCFFLFLFWTALHISNSHLVGCIMSSISLFPFLSSFRYLSFFNILTIWFIGSFIRS